MTRAYLELLRPANVTTALADVLAGFAVAGLLNWTALPWLLLSTACLYGGGVVLNDVFDRDIDRTERPERPIPSGRVALQGAAAFGGGLLAAGVAAGWAATSAAGWIATAIAALVLLYDAWGKRHALIGPLNMALCRALNLLLGVAAVPTALTTSWPLAAIPLLYIWAVTTLSRGEVHGGSRRAATSALISLSLALLALTGATMRAEASPAAALLLTGLLAWRVLPAFWSAWRRPAPLTIRSAVRTGVLSLVLLDAALGAAFGGAAWGAIILGTGLAAAWLARRFAVT
jgi:4-hydroxybenzoate polyprenyltransferase